MESVVTAGRTIVAAGLASIMLASHTMAQSDGSNGTLDERIVSGLSQSDVSITATFSGQEIFVYGAIERSRFLEEGETPPDVILVVEGPEEPILIRKKERIAGIWANRFSALISAAPSFYAVSSSRPVSDILSPHEIEIYDIGLAQTILAPGTATGPDEPEVYRQAAVRLKRTDGLYRRLPDGVRVLGESLFDSRIQLPSNIVEGDYRMRVLLVRDQQVIDTHQLIIPVRRTGIGQWIYRLAQDEPFTYGILAILVGLLAGWMAAEAFRRLQA